MDDDDDGDDMNYGASFGAGYGGEPTVQDGPTTEAHHSSHNGWDCPFLAPPNEPFIQLLDNVGGPGLNAGGAWDGGQGHNDPDGGFWNLGAASPRPGEATETLDPLRGSPVWW